MPTRGSADVTDRELLDFVRENVTEGNRFEASEFRDELRIVLDEDDLVPVCRTLKETGPYYFLHLSDVTAVDYPDRDGPRFDVVYQLYSFKLNRRLRLKLRVDDRAPSVTDLWSTANWLERECYDMFGIEFDGHPNLRRILMPAATQSHPLRKDYPISPRKDYQQRRVEAAQQAEEWGEEYEHHPR